MGSLWLNIQEFERLPLKRRVPCGDLEGFGARDAINRGDRRWIGSTPTGSMGRFAVHDRFRTRSPGRRGACSRASDRRNAGAFVSGRNGILDYESAVVIKEHIDAQEALIDKITFGRIP